MSPPRPYEALLSEVARDGPREQRMRRLVDLLWDRLSPTGVSWIGFYLHEAGDELVLGPRRDRPACSPIGLHGACGRSFRERRPLVVGDVKRLGASYVACDPRDQSEVVIPLIDAGGACWGVLDADSHALSAFDQRDVDGLSAALRAAGLMRASHAAEDTIVV